MKTIAIVTGASSGMGRDFVAELLKEKQIDEIWMIARRKQRLESMAFKCPERLKWLALDLVEEDSCEKLKKHLEQEPVRISFLVNGAGAGYMGSVEEISLEHHSFVLDLNVKALTGITHVCLPYMSKDGHIIQLCSGAAFLPQPGFAVYAASKSYVLSFSRALRNELKNRGIRVTAVCPGPVKTEFFEASGSSIHPSKKRFMSESKDVVRQAMKDAKKGRELSVYGKSMKLVHFIGKIIPTKVSLWGMNRVLK